MDKTLEYGNFSVQEPKEKLDKLHVKAGQVHWIEYSLEKGDAVSFLVTGISVNKRPWRV